MPNYIVQDNQIHFRQSFSRDILRNLFVTIYALELTIYDTGSKRYPHMVILSESEFLSVLDMAQSN